MNLSHSGAALAAMDKAGSPGTYAEARGRKKTAGCASLPSISLDFFTTIPSGGHDRDDRSSASPAKKCYEDQLGLFDEAETDEGEDSDHSPSCLFSDSDGEDELGGNFFLTANYAGPTFGVQAGTATGARQQHLHFDLQDSELGFFCGSHGLLMDTTGIPSPRKRTRAAYHSRSPGEDDDFLPGEQNSGKTDFFDLSLMMPHMGAPAVAEDVAQHHRLGAVLPPQEMLPPSSTDAPPSDVASSEQDHTHLEHEHDTTCTVSTNDRVCLDSCSSTTCSGSSPGGAATTTGSLLFLAGAASSAQTVVPVFHQQELHQQQQSYYSRALLLKVRERMALPLRKRCIVPGTVFPDALDEGANETRKNLKKLHFSDTTTTTTPVIFDASCDPLEEREVGKENKVNDGSMIPCTASAALDVDTKNHAQMFSSDGDLFCGPKLQVPWKTIRKTRTPLEELRAEKMRQNCNAVRLSRESLFQEDRRVNMVMDAAMNNVREDNDNGDARLRSDPAGGAKQPWKPRSLLQRKAEQAAKSDQLGFRQAEMNGRTLGGGGRTNTDSKRFGDETPTVSSESGYGTSATTMSINGAPVRTLPQSDLCGYVPGYVERSKKTCHGSFFKRNRANVTSHSWRRGSAQDAADRVAQ
ncbi:unnamed protein product [Amoebophrya sp. A120]|nr:unnamed protein product [Amoebophrya sp. A120]|eukprot:GSA120T00017443001.1